VLPDQGAQSFLSGVLAPQLLCFFLDLLAVAPHSQDFALELLHPQLVLYLALLVVQYQLLVLNPALLELLHLQLVTGIPSPVERR
jgi:hypothetical protein